MSDAIAIDEAVALLRQAHETATAIAELPLTARPSTLDEAYAIQDAFHAAIGEPLVGWKVGATSAVAQKILQVDEPFAGRYRSGAVHASPARVAAADFVQAPMVEVEVALYPTTDLTEVPADPLDLAEVVEVAPAIELVDSRFADSFGVGVLSLIADNGVATACVVGDRLDLSTAEIRAMGATSVEVEHNGEMAATGSAADALGHPLNVLHWLVRHTLARGQTVSAGELVITGTCTGIVPTSPGDRLVGRVDSTPVEVTIT